MRSVSLINVLSRLSLLLWSRGDLGSFLRIRANFKLVYYAKINSVGKLLDVVCNFRIYHFQLCHFCMPIFRKKRLFILKI